MTPPQEPPLQSTKKDRLAAALRENLRRRKAQRVGRANSAVPDAESAHPHERDQAPADITEDGGRN
ncbi:MAG: hypothetical protein EPN75_10350 [Beijerinckiaceae bacterium]|nr:MAG: hypothetical protein EPN75_10350 [Beijerinckiaceae bacterium]